MSKNGEPQCSCKYILQCDIGIEGITNIIMGIQKFYEIVTSLVLTLQGGVEYNEKASKGTCILVIYLVCVI